MKNNQKGFAVSHLALLVLALGLVGGTGFYVYNQGKNNKVSQSQDSKNAESETVELLATDLSDLKPIAEIRSAATVELNGASIVGIELEQEGNSPVYHVKLSDGRKITYNAKTGIKITSASGEKFESDEAVPSDFVPGITVEQARATAMNEHPGSAVKKIELEMEDGKVVYSVRFVDGSRVDVNATDGSVVRVKNETETDDDSSNSADDDNNEDESDDSSNSSNDADDDSADDSNSNSGSSNSGSGSGHSDD